MRLIPLLFLFVSASLCQQQPPHFQTRRGGGGQPGQPNGQTAVNGQPAPVAVDPATFGSISGILANSLSGEPLGKATVTLRIVDSGDRQAGGVPRSYAATSDASGQFFIPNVAPGKFRLSAKRTGYVELDYGANDPQYNGSIITLNAKQALTGILFRLPPHGVITGKVLDQDGEPMQSVQVQAMKVKYSQGRKQLISYGDASTNDIGEFRVYGLPPGRYYLNVSPRRNDFGGGGPPGRGMRTVVAQVPDEEYTSAYYPGTSDIATAIPIELAAGAQLRGFELTLRKKRTVKVRGRVLDTTGSDPNRMMVSLIPTGPVSPGSTRRAMRIDQNGNFEILSVTPGSYNLVAAIPARGKSVSGRVPLQVGNSGVENAAITLNPPMTLTGRIRIDGNTTLAPSNIQLSLRSLEPDLSMFGGPPASAKSDANGAFQLQNVNPDLYAFSISGLPDGMYVKSVLVNGVDAQLTGLDLTRGGTGPIDIVLSPNAGSATGLVQNEQQQPATNITVVMVPQELERKSQPQFYRTASTDTTGRFTFANLTPGSYRVYAWEVIESGAYMDPDFMRPFENRGEPVQIKESGKEDLQVKMTS